MEFDCWTGLLIEGKPYTIVEKIRYREKASDERWTEYGLVSGTKEEGWWLSVMDGGLHCTLSRTVSRVTAPKRYRLHDKGTEVVEGVWGISDASVGETASYREYESEDGRYTFFMEDWEGNRLGSAGWHVDPAQVCLDSTEASSVRAQSVKWEVRKRFLKKRGWTYVVTFLYLFFLIWWVGDLADDFRWHDVRRFFHVPYQMEERLSDAPYYRPIKEEESQYRGRVYESSLDPGASAMDLIESVDGWTKEVRQDLSALDRPIVIKTQDEVCRVAKSAEGKTKIWIGAVEDVPVEKAADRVHQDETLARYASLIRSASTDGRRSVVQQ